jgi:hypothetical protein
VLKMSFDEKCLNDFLNIYNPFCVNPPRKYRFGRVEKHVDVPSRFYSSHDTVMYILFGQK